jgi:hypothetical protein
MKSRMKSRLTRALLAGALAIGATTALSVAAPAPAEAGMSRLYTMHCWWPGKATFDLVNDESYNRYEWTAYSPSGWRLGTNVARSWYTPWEDVTVRVYSPNDSYFDVVRWCR